MTAEDAPRRVRVDLADLVENLRRAEFRVGASEAIDATALLLALGNRGVKLENPARLRSRLRPVFCKSADEQHRFDPIFDDWWSRLAPEPTGPDPPEGSAPEEKKQAGTADKDRRTTSPILIAGVFWSLAAIGIAFFVRGRPQQPSSASPTATSPVPSGSPTTRPTREPALPVEASPGIDHFVPAVRYNVEIRPWWVWLLGAFPIAAFLSVGLPILVLSRTRLRRRSEPMFLDPTPLEAEARRLVPGMQPDISDRLARHVRSRGIDIERQARRPSLDIRRTLEATVRNYGVPTLRFSIARVHPSYLVLIDVANEIDPRGRLFYQWAERLQREGLHVELLFLRKMELGGDVDSLRVCNAREARRGNGQWIPLRRLREPAFGERLIVVSDGHLIVNAAGQWQRDATRARFYRWRDRVLFTPVEPRDWGVREERLERAERVTDPGFIVLPLEESALAAWADLVLTGQLSIVTLADPQRFPTLLRKGGQHRFQSAEPPPAEIIERLIQQLQLYLGDRGFYWLAAIAATPIVRWELTLLLGKAVLSRLPRLADQDALDASLARNYRRLVRLPWLQRDAMPDWLRLRLLLELSQAQQAALRELLEKLLAKLPPREVPDGIKLSFERPPGSEVPWDFEVRPRDARAEGDAIYLGYMSGLSPDQLALRAPRQWASWAARASLRRDTGWRGRFARLRARVRAQWAKWIWARGLPHLGMNRRRIAVVGLLILPLVGALALAKRSAPESPLMVSSRFFQERAHAKVIFAALPTAVAYSRDRSRVASGHGDGTLRLWDPRTTHSIGAPLTAHSAPVESLAFSPDGTKLASLAIDRTVTLSQIGGAGAAPREIARGIRSIAFSPDGTRLALGGSDSSVRLWDVQTGVSIDVPRAQHVGDVVAMAFMPGGLELRAAVVDANRTLRLRRVGVDGSEIAEPAQSAHTVTGFRVALSHDGGRLASGGDNRVLELWNLETGRPEGGATQGHEDAITRVLFSPDASRVASASNDQTIRVWDARTGAAVGAPLRGHSGSVTDIAFSADSLQLVSASADGTLRFWDARPAMVVKSTAEGATGDVYGVAYSPDGRRFVSSGSQGALQVWDAQTLNPIGAPLRGHTGDTGGGNGGGTGGTGDVNHVAYSPDGRHIASGGDDGTVRLWDAQTGSAERVLEGHTGVVWCVAFSPDGRLLASSSGDSTIRVWNVLAGASVARMDGHTDAVIAVAFSPDGRRLASGGDDGTVRIWDVQTGTLVSAPMSGHRGSIWSLAFSADSTRVVSGDYQGYLYVWEAATGKPARGPLQIGQTDTTEMPLAPGITG